MCLWTEDSSIEASGCSICLKPPWTCLSLASARSVEADGSARAPTPLLYSASGQRSLRASLRDAPPVRGKCAQSPVRCRAAGATSPARCTSPCRATTGKTVLRALDDCWSPPTVMRTRITLASNQEVGIPCVDSTSANIDADAPLAHPVPGHAALSFDDPPTPSRSASTPSPVCPSRPQAGSSSSSHDPTRVNLKGGTKRGIEASKSLN